MSREGFGGGGGGERVEGGRGLDIEGAFRAFSIGEAGETGGKTGRDPEVVGLF